MQKCTLYVTSDFLGNILKIECSVAQFHIVGTASAMVNVEFVPKGARKARVYRANRRPWFFIVDGWGHVDPESAFTAPIVDENGTAVSKGRYMSHDPRWRENFDRDFAAYVATSGARVLADFRGGIPAEMLTVSTAV